MTNDDPDMPDLVARDGDEIEDTVATVGGDSAAAVSPVAVSPVAATAAPQRQCLLLRIFLFAPSIDSPDFRCFLPWRRRRQWLLPLGNGGGSS